MEKIQSIFMILVCSWMLAGRINGERAIPDVQEVKGYTTFRVYAHEHFAGPNATLHEIARANITANSPTQFGLMRVVDDLVTSGPDPGDSDKLGRAQGFVINTGLTDSDVMLQVNFVFTGGAHQGSVLAVAGNRNLSGTGGHELPITGGSGVFRWAQGYSVSQILSFNLSTNYIRFVYDFYIKTSVS